MIAQSLSKQEQSKVVDNYMGVDLTSYNCHELKLDDRFKSYSKQQLHYVIDAIQKGRKLPTRTGLKRLMKRSLKNKAKNTKNSKAIEPLNPKCPEAICLKSLRTEFRYKLEKVHTQQIKPRSAQKQKQIDKRKLNQRRRRNELIRLVKKYGKELTPHFGLRLSTYRGGRTPKVSRKEVRDFLQSKGINPVLDPVPVQPKEGTLGMNTNVSRRIVRHQVGSIRGSNSLGIPNTALYGPVIPMIGMNLPIVAGNQSGVQALQSQLNSLNLNINSHTPPTLTDEDFPSLLG